MAPEILRLLLQLSNLDPELPDGRSEKEYERQAAFEELLGQQRRKRALLAQLPETVVARVRALTRAGRHPLVAPLRNGYCAVCHLRIPPQLANLVAQAQEASACPHCGRLLYHPQQEEADEWSARRRPTSIRGC